MTPSCDRADDVRFPLHALWVNRVPEPKTVKNRCHWDVTGSVADPQGNELCVF